MMIMTSQSTAKTLTADLDKLFPEGHELKVVAQAGDARITWDADKSGEVDHAKKTFEYYTGEKKYAAFTAKKDGSQGEKIKSFDPKAEALIFVPPIAGG